MRRLYTRVLVALLATVVLSFLAYVGVFFRLTQPAVKNLISSLQAVVLDQAVTALHCDGVTGAQKVLQSWAFTEGSRHYLIDTTGRDLIGGDDRSEWLLRESDVTLARPSSCWCADRPTDSSGSSPWRPLRLGSEMSSPTTRCWCWRSPCCAGFSLSIW